MRKPKDRTPALSDYSVDKMMACLNYNVGKWGTKNADYVKGAVLFRRLVGVVSAPIPISPGDGFLGDRRMGLS